MMVVVLATCRVVAETENRNAPHSNTPNCKVVQLNGHIFFLFSKWCKRVSLVVEFQPQHSGVLHHVVLLGDQGVGEDGLGGGREQHFHDG